MDKKENINNFKNYYKNILKDRYDEFEANLLTDKKKTFRVNSSRNINYIDNELTDLFKLSTYENHDNIFVVEDQLTDTNLSETISHITGGIYIMNVSSILTAKIVAKLIPENVKDNPLILDISAAPGGKTSAISDYIGRKGMIIANEISHSRLKSLHFNLERNGCYNVLTTSLDGRILNKFMDSSIDVILLDAPCSNENKFFRDKTVQALWSEQSIDKMAKLQKELITSAYKCLKEGGVLIYSTCTMNINENEGIIKYLLSIEETAELIDINDIDQSSDYGLLGDSHIDKCVARIMPSASVDAFFIAAIRKKGELDTVDIIDSCEKKSDTQIKFFDDYFKDGFIENISITEADNRGYIKPKDIDKNYEFINKLKFSRRGLNLYRLAKTELYLQSQSLWEFGRLVNKERISNIDYNDAKQFLKGFDLQTSNNYNGNCMFYNGIPIGTTKLLGNIAKNKLDRYFLYS